MLPPESPFGELPPPLVVIGMHRSGTSVVAGMLGALGVYMGPGLRIPTEADPASLQERLRTEGYGEALAFVRVNEALLAAAEADWCRVEPLLQRRDTPELAARAEALIASALSGPLRRDYLQPELESARRAWGWKDPRTTLTLPYWLRFFPHARVLHVRREAEAVVRSLTRRSGGAGAAGAPLPSGERLRWWLSHPGEALRRAGSKLGLAPLSPPPSNPSTDPNYARALWERYVTEAERFREHPGGYLELRFEELRADPLAAARALARYAASEAGEEEILRAASLVR
ncbi:MAG: sulfotransferase [Armatimonadota bacterium]